MSTNLIRANFLAYVLLAGRLCLGAPGGAETLLLDETFAGKAGPLTERPDSFFVGRDRAIQLDGQGHAGLVKATDGYVKCPLELPENIERVRITAEVKLSPMPDSAMRNHHAKGEQPVWVALGVSGNTVPAAGLAASRLSVSVSGDGRKLSLGLGRAVGAVAPEFGVKQVDGPGACEVALEYDFKTGTASASLNGNVLLTASAKCSLADFACLGFQLRRMQPLGSAAPGVIQRLKVEAVLGGLVKVSPPPPAVPESAPPRLNAEHERAVALDKQLDEAKSAADTLAALKAGWDNPPATYRPHTRWWWPGNAVTTEGIDWQLEQMKAQGMGGVEIMSFLSIYEKGNINFGSPEFMAVVKHTVAKARELGMEVALNLGPGWGHGNAEVPEADRSKALVFAKQPVKGGEDFAGTLALPQEPAYAARAKKKFEAAVAVALDAQGKPNPAQRIDLSAAVQGSRDFAPRPKLTVNAKLPAGAWQLISFWTVYTLQKCAAEDNDPPTALVDHLKKSAVHDYAVNMGNRYRQAFGADFGQTVDSIFGDSYELHQDFSLWSDGLFERFEKEQGYDLRPWLPLLLYPGAPETPYVRYDFNHFLHRLGMEAAIEELAAYCEAAGVHMRQQPHYRFPAELIEASGALQRPETEFTRRSFEPNAYPHKVTTSGAWLYPAKQKRWVSCEAFTFSNDRYRSTLEELKRGTDLFLRDGITQFYNHGYFYTPEKEVDPARDLIWMNRISHVNPWWPYYRGLADYQARAAFLSRQGRAQAAVLVYSPMPTVWSERAEYPCSHVRDLPFGKLPKILVASGYDFDCVNDDLLQHHAQIKDGQIVINGYRYSALVLPRTLCLAPETLQVVEQFATAGGAVFALNSLPFVSAGLKQHERNDAALRELRDRLFAVQGGEKKLGRGASYFLPECDGFEYLKTWSPGAKEWEPTAPLSPAYQTFIAKLRGHVPPDFEIAGVPLSQGLTFRHTRIGEVDCWFICNLQPNRHAGEVTLNTRGKVPQIWDALAGGIRPVENFREASDGRIALSVTLEPWQSLFVLLAPRGSPVPATAAPVRADVLNRTLPLTGAWKVSFRGLGKFQTNLVLTALADWTKISGLANFSGAAIYTLEFDADGLGRDVALDLGTVHEVAAVRLNGQPVGALWMQPYRLDISKHLRPGQNRLEIEVANLLWNYCAGLEKPTPIPAELHEHYGASWRQNYSAWNAFQQNKNRHHNERLPSGLLGPVQLLTARPDAARQ